MLKQLLLITALAVAIGTTCAAAPIFGFATSTPIVTLGNNFTVDVTVTGAVDLYDWQLDVQWLPADRASASNVTEGPFLGAGTTFLPGNIDNVNGMITFMADTLNGMVPGANGAGVLAHILYSSLTSGILNFSLANVLADDSQGNPIVPGPSTGLAVTIVPNSTVPEPATFGLLAMGLALGAVVRRRT